MEGEWIPTGGPNDDLLAGDYEAFEECRARAGKVREGDWSPYATLGWVVSQHEEFVAAIQIYEKESAAGNPGEFAATAWMVLGNIASSRFGRNFTEAEEDLRRALESDQIDGATALERHSGNLVLVPRHLWRQWQRSYENYGLVLIPGLYDFKWPSRSVRTAFPSGGATENSPAVPRIPTGSAGRPTAKDIYLLIFEERCASGEALTGVKAEARAITSKYNSDPRYPREGGWPEVKSSTVENNIRSVHQRWRAAALK